MATVTDVTTRPASGLNHIDALMDRGPGWNWLAPARSTLFYTFALNDGNASDIGSEITAAPVAFNASQQAAAVAALAKLSAITGISFVATADGAAADLHFGAANIITASTSGLASWKNSYSFSGSTITSYTADAYIYLDNVEFAATNGTPTAGTTGFEVLLHELGHAFGLKHPFEGSITLPGGEDNTANTLMSYTHSGGPYSDFAPYDVAALLFLYGGDGLGGALGHSSSGQYLVGTGAANTLSGGTGNDVLEGKAGNDTINGGGGTDTAVFSGNRALYSWTVTGSGISITGPDGTDTLGGVEQLRFADMTVTVGGAGGNTPPTGTLAVTGTVRQGEALGVSSTVADADGLGTLTYRWQSSPDGSTWTNINGATAASFTPAQAQVGLRLRVVGSYTDGAGTAETVNSAATAVVANVNDAPTGAITLLGTARQGVALGTELTLADADGLGVISLRWQQSANGSTWTDIAGATGSSFTPGAAQVGQVVRVVASYTDGQGTAESVPSAASTLVGPANRAPTGGLAVSGQAQQGQTLSVASTIADADGLGTISLRWQSSSNGTDWADISGAGGSSLVLAEAQVGLQLRAVASYTDGLGTAETVASAATSAVANVNDAPTGGVAVSGTPLQGNTLRASSTLADADGLGTLAWRWQSSADGSTWADIGGATASSFTPGQAQVGLRLRVVGSYTDGRGTAESATSSASAAVANTNDGPTGSVTLAGTARQGQTLTASTQTLADADGLGTLTLQWQRSSDGLAWADIGGATDTSLTLDQALVGQRLRAVARYTDGQGTAESVASSSTTPVTNVNDVPSGDIRFDQAAKIGQPLTATVNLSDADGLGTLRHEWQQSLTGASWQAITGATGLSFTPTATQAGLLLRLVVRYTDGQGTAETVPSAPLGPVLTVQTGTAGADTLTGSVLADELNGLAGHDRLIGGVGHDVLNGGAGLDTAVLNGPRSAYQVTRSGNGLTVQDTQGSDGTDTLTEVERLQFTDQHLAFDLDGNAGTVARDLGAVFGREAVANKAYAGIGLGLLDNGTTAAALMQLALDARLGTGFSHTALVDLLYTNLVGSAPSAADRAFWVNTLTSGQYTPVGLATMAAELALNADNIGLVGLADSGLAYTPAA